MTFHETQINRDISLNSQLTLTRSTQIATSASGDEDRNAQWHHSLRRANIGYAARQADTIREIIAFFDNRNGSAYGFRYRDWVDYKAENELIGTGDGARTIFQILRRSTSGRQSYERPILKPVYGTVEIQVDGLAVNNAVINHSNGLVYLRDAPQEGAPITATFEFDVAMRFENDVLPATLFTSDVMGAPDIPLIEVRRADPEDGEAVDYNFPESAASIWTQIATALEGIPA